MNLFIINPRAGNGNGLNVWSLVERECKKQRVPYVAYLSDSPEEAEDRVRTHLEQYPNSVVAVIGGDGTIHRLLSVIEQRSGILAIIPAGSGNDTARGFGIPMDPLGALRVIVQGKIQQVDMLKSHGRWTLTALATGFDSAVADVVNRSFYKRWCNKLRLGQVAYLIGIIHTLFTFKPTSMSIRIDDETITLDRVWLAAISNVNSYGGGIRICPEARADDGLFDMCIVHGCSRMTLLRLLPTVFTGKHVNLSYVTMRRGRRIQVEPISEVITIGDGEPVGVGTFEAQLHPNQISMYVP
ncbi:diacylglycerol/lipid kinase family protein [Paenibacillus marinisediminis]